MKTLLTHLPQVVLGGVPPPSFFQRSPMAATTLYFSYLLLLQIFTGWSSSSTCASDTDILLTAIKTSLKGNTENLILNSWNSSTPLCQWRGLTWIDTNGAPLNCTNTTSFSSLRTYLDPSLHLLSIQLPSANLTGALPRELGQLSMLQSLYLNLNSLSGGVPLELGYSPSLSAVDLNGNHLTGQLPPSIWNLCHVLISLNFNGNFLSGAPTRPSPINTSCESLLLLDLGNNRFSGEFPEFVLRFKSLKELDLSGNLFSGSIPAGVADLNNLEKFNLSNNRFSGALPRTGYGVDVFQGNEAGLCGRPLRRCSKLSSGAVAVILIGVMAGGVVSASVLIGYSHGRRWRRWRRRGGYGDEDSCGGEGGGGGGGGGEGRLVLFEGGEQFTLEDVLNATGQVVEKTYYGTVYKAKLENGGNIGLRLLREGSCKDSSSCLAAMRVLGRIRHDNLVPIRAFYQGKKGEKLLISDYLPHKSLHTILHETKGGRSSLNWGRRHKILAGVGRALEHLHTGGEGAVTHGDVGSRNVLVDECYTGRVVGFGVERLMAGAAGREMVEMAKREGYKAPELKEMKRCNGRTDVYAFGILLLEMLTGRRPGAVDGSSGRDPDPDLPSLVKAAVLEEATAEVFDPEIVRGMRRGDGGGGLDEGLVQTLKLAMGCCAPVPSLRPTMTDVVCQLEAYRPRNRSALYTPVDSTSGVATPF